MSRNTMIAFVVTLSLVACAVIGATALSNATNDANTMNDIADVTVTESYSAYAYGNIGQGAKGITYEVPSEASKLSTEYGAAAEMVGDIVYSTTYEVPSEASKLSTEYDAAAEMVVDLDEGQTYNTVVTCTEETLSMNSNGWYALSN